MAYKIMGTTSSPFYSDMMIYYIMCDTPADLPSTISDIGYGTTIGYGSRADIISDSSKYIWNGSQWVRQKSGQEIEIGANDIVYDNTDSGMTATNVQDAIDELKDTDDIQDSALAELHDENANQQLEIDYVINTGAKNLLDYTFSINGNTSARTSNGVTFTINADKSISTSGTASANITSAWIQLNYAVPDDPVILSGCPTGGANNKYKIDILDGSPTSAVVAEDYGNGVVIKSSMFTNGTGLIRIRIEKNQNVDGLVFKPMVRPAEITDDAYVPYAKTNVELTVAEDEDRTALIGHVDGEQKNLIDTRRPDGINHETITPGSNGYVTATTNQAWANSQYEVTGEVGKAYKVVVEVSSADTSQAQFQCFVNAIKGEARTELARTPRILTAGTYVIDFIATAETIKLSVNLNNSATVTSATATYRVLFCTAADYAITPAFVPYAPTNRELYELCETKASLNDIYGIKNQLPNGTDLNNLTAGCMTCPGATVAASLLNCPTTTDAFIIYTDYLAAASRAIQRIYSFSTTTGIPSQYMRVRWSQGWTPWYQVTMQQVASASTQSLNSPLLLNREEIAPLETTEIRETEETEETNETEETE